MDLTRQAETMIDLLSSSHTEEDDIYQIFNLSRGSSLYAAWLWDGILLWGNEIRLDKLSYPMTLFNENDYLLLRQRAAIVIREGITRGSKCVLIFAD